MDGNIISLKLSLTQKGIFLYSTAIKIQTIMAMNQQTSGWYISKLFGKYQLAGLR